jgi:purine-binding chemotaxis protein CheW
MPELPPIDAAVRSFCTFRLDRRLYGVEVSQVREVSVDLPMTPVPQSPAAVRGLFNLRSRIYLGLDMRPLLGLAPTICGAESRLIILKAGVAEDMGVLVEQGGDIVHAPADLMEIAGVGAESPAEGGSPLIAGLCKLPNELMMLVDLSRLTEIVTNLIR